MPTKGRDPRTLSRPSTFPDPFHARTGRASLLGDNGQETDRERIATLEALLEKMQADGMTCTAAIQSQLDALVAKQSP